MHSSKLLNIFPTPRFLKFSYVGVELRHHALRYAELYNDGKGMRLGRFGEKIFPRFPDILSNEGLKNALREMKEKDGVEYVKCILPEEETYLFTMEVEGTTWEEAKDSIEFHLEENVPISGSEALFEFYILPNQPGSKRKVMVSVVARQTVSKYISFFEECGITPVSFMVESSSLSRAVISKDDLDTSLIVYLSNQKTMCAVVSGGYVQFSSTVNAGGSIITEAIQKYYEVSSEEAEQMKKEKGLLKSEDGSETFSVLANAVSVIRDEIERVSIYWQTHHDKDSHMPIKKIIIVGNDAGIPGFADYLSASLKNEVNIADVWQNIPRYKQEVPPIDYKDSLAFGACLGLSLG